MPALLQDTSHTFLTFATEGFNPNCLAAKGDPPRNWSELPPFSRLSRNKLAIASGDEVQLPSPHAATSDLLSDGNDR